MWWCVYEQFYYTFYLNFVIYPYYLNHLPSQDLYRYIRQPRCSSQYQSLTPNFSHMQNTCPRLETIDHRVPRFSSITAPRRDYRVSPKNFDRLRGSFEIYHLRMHNDKCQRWYYEASRRFLGPHISPGHPKSGTRMSAKIKGSRSGPDKGWNDRQYGSKRRKV